MEPASRRRVCDGWDEAEPVVGLLGAYRYVDNYWLYRGFSAPSDPAYVTARGTAVQLRVATFNQKDMPVLEQLWTMLVLAAPATGT